MGKERRNRSDMYYTYILNANNNKSLSMELSTCTLSYGTDKYTTISLSTGNL